MTAHLSLDSKLIEATVKVSGELTEKAAVTRAREIHSPPKANICSICWTSSGPRTFCS